MSMMDDVLVNAKSALDQVGKKAGNLVDRSKLLMAATDIRAELARKYRLLGRICYEAHRSGKNYDKGVQSLEDDITELNIQLESVKEMLDQAKKKVKCPECGASNSKGSVFCNQCGSRLPVTKAVKKDDFSTEELLAYAEETLDEDLDI